MKRLFSVLAAIALSVAVAAPAMAIYETGNFQLAAYEGYFLDTATGNTAHFELGMGQDFTTSFADRNTGISLDDYTNATTDSWSDISLQIFGGGYVADYSADAPIFMTAIPAVTQANLSQSVYSAYQTVVDWNAYLSDTSAKVVMAKNVDPYVNWLSPHQQGVSNITTEIVLADDSVLSLDFFSYDGKDRTTWTKIGTFELDTTGSTLLVSYNAVPVPGALIMMCTGLLSLVGIVRKKA